MRKMQTRQQPETIKQKKFKKRLPCSLQQWIQTHTPKRILNIPIKNIVNKFDKHHKHTIKIKYMPVLSQIYLSILSLFYVGLEFSLRHYLVWCWSIHIHFILAWGHTKIVIQGGFRPLLKTDRWSLYKNTKFKEHEE
jgi:hypothetical protein